MKKSPNNLTVRAALQIQKPVAEVFDAIVDKEKMNNYFISNASENISANKTVHWEFPEFEGSFPVEIGEVIDNKLISFLWESSEGQNIKVDINLEEAPGNNTVVRITEGDMENTEAGVEWLVRNTEGWANFLACLKAYSEHGINLRKGGFDFMKK